MAEGALGLCSEIPREDRPDPRYQSGSQWSHIHLSIGFSPIPSRISFPVSAFQAFRAHQRSELRLPGRLGISLIVLTAPLA